MMQAKIEYIESGTKKVRSAEGSLMFGDACLSEYIGLKRNGNWLWIPTALVITIETYELDEDLLTVDLANMKSSKLHALNRMKKDIARDNGNGGFQ